MFIEKSKTIDILRYCKFSKRIKHKKFRVFMRDTLPKQISNKRHKSPSSPWDIEREILNLDVSKNNDTH